MSLAAFVASAALRCSGLAVNQIPIGLNSLPQSKNLEINETVMEVIL